MIKGPCTLTPTLILTPTLSLTLTLTLTTDPNPLSPTANPHPRPNQVMKDRVSGWQPGQPKPLWTELVKALGDDFKPIMQLVYADE